MNRVGTEQISDQIKIVLLIAKYVLFIRKRLKKGTSPPTVGFDIKNSGVYFSVAELFNYF